MDSIRAEGHLYASEGVSDRCGAWRTKFSPDMIHAGGFVFGSPTAGSSRPTTGTGTQPALREQQHHPRDHHGRPQAAAQAASGGAMNQYQQVPRRSYWWAARIRSPTCPACTIPRSCWRSWAAPRCPTSSGWTARSASRLARPRQQRRRQERDYGWVFDPFPVTSGDIRCQSVPDRLLASIRLPSSPPQ